MPRSRAVFVISGLVVMLMAAVAGTKIFASMRLRREALTESQQAPTEPQLGAGHESPSVS